MARSPDSVSTKERNRPSSDGAPRRLVSGPAQIRCAEAPLSSALSQAPKIAGIDAAQNRRRRNRIVAIEYRISQYAARRSGFKSG